MLSELLQTLIQQPYLEPLDPDLWVGFSEKYQTLPESDQDTLIEALKSHTALGRVVIKDSLYNLQKAFTMEEKESILLVLKQDESKNKLLIKLFIESHTFDYINLNILKPSNFEWLTIASQFAKSQRKKLSNVFFVTCLASIRHVSYYSLIASTRSQPFRATKAIAHNYSAASKIKPYSRPCIKDGGVNNLILDHKDGDDELEKGLSATGVRIASLVDASPVKGEIGVKRTPGKTKVRIFSAINGHEFFTPLTPEGKRERWGRVRISQPCSPTSVCLSLPKLNANRANPVEYTATLANISKRAGKERRTNQKSEMGASAADVFRAYGIEIQSIDSRHHHWAHLIGHFFGAHENITSTDSDQPIINLVPSTAAANYNTLEAIELFIRDKLVREETDMISIFVTPVYSDTAIIPDVLIYHLSWKEQALDCVETFYIHPQSYRPITASMHAAIKLVRATRDPSLDLDMTAVEEGHQSTTQANSVF